MLNNNQTSTQNLQPWERPASIFGLQPWERNTSILSVQPWEMNKFINNIPLPANNLIVQPQAQPQIHLAPVAKPEVAKKPVASIASSLSLSSSVSKPKAPVAKHVAKDSTIQSISSTDTGTSKPLQIIAPDKSYSAMLFGPKKIEISKEGLDNLRAEQKTNIVVEVKALPIGKSVRSHIIDANKEKSWLTAGRPINASNDQIVVAPESNSNWLASWFEKKIPTAPLLSENTKYHTSTNIYQQIVDTIKTIISAKLSSAAVNRVVEEEQKSNSSNILIPDAVTNQVARQSENKSLKEQRGYSIM